MWLAIKTKAQSPTNRAAGRLQDCVGGRSAPLCPLLPHIIPLIIIATRLAPNQEQVLFTSVLVALVPPHPPTFKFNWSLSPHLCVTGEADLLSYNPQV